MIVARTTQQQTKPDQLILRELYGLTPSEVEVAGALMSGTCRKTIARERGVSLSTIQTQIKVIFRKVDVGREMELVNKLAWIAGVG